MIRRGWIFCIAVALAASVSGIRNGFVLDDAAIIVSQGRLQDVGRWGEILTKPYWPPPYSPDLYRPVLSLGLSLQYLEGGGSPFVFRLVSYTLYCVAVLAFLVLARRLLPASIALAVALLFAAHPVHVEAVAVAVAQNELIVAIVTIAAVVHYLDCRSSERGLRARDWLILAACYAIAALSKENGLTLPGFLVLAELLLVRGHTFRARLDSLWKGYAGLALVLLVILVVRLVVLRENVVAPETATEIAEKDFAGRTLMMLKAVPEWFRLLVWPRHLRADYSPQEYTISASLGAQEMAGLALLLGFGALAWVCRRRSPVVTFGIAFAALAFLPVSNLLVRIGILIAERTLFLPSVGFLLAVGALSAIALEKLQPRWPRAGVVAAAAAGVLVVSGVWRSATRHPTWATRSTFVQSLVQDSPRSWWAHWNLAEVMADERRVPDARAAFERSIELAPLPWLVRNHYAKRMRQAGDEQEAAKQLDLSLKQNPRQKEAIYQYVAALIGLGRYRVASDMAAQVMQHPDAPPSMVMLRAVADRAEATNAPAGSIRIGVPKQSQ